MPAINMLSEILIFVVIFIIFKLGCFQKFLFRDNLLVILYMKDYNIFNEYNKSIIIIFFIYSVYSLIFNNLFDECPAKI